MDSGATAMMRRLRWVERAAFSGWGCSKCPRTFRPAGSLGPMSINELVDKTQTQLDEDFLSHDCVLATDPESSLAESLGETD
jgi:hypothetical protein